MCRHISELGVFAVPLEDARHRRFHIGGGARLFGWRRRAPSAQQRHIETDIQARGKHSLGFIRLIGFANGPTVL